jgi:glycosyltransferase involved in cell wall biosynthesis
MTGTYPARVLHVITDLAMGGAEMVLFHLLSTQDPNEFSNQVVSLTDSGLVGERISGLGIPVHTLRGRKSFPDPRLVIDLSRLIRNQQPDMIQTWMYHADLVGGLSSRLANCPPVVWGLHHTISSPYSLRPRTRLVARLNAHLSSAIPTKIVCCSNATLTSHVQFGYQPEKMIVISNGIDPQLFQPDIFARRTVRSELDINEQALVIGLCARFDPQKDHHNFVEAASILSCQFPDVYCVLWGKDVDDRNRELTDWIRKSGIEKQVRLLGLRPDSARLMASVDIACLSSAYGEAFPLVVGEAMACGIPCVATDIGDTSLLIGETGKTVPPRNPQALASAWTELLQLNPDARHELGLLARQRILDHFSLASMTLAYGRLYHDIIKTRLEDLE